MNAPPKTPPPPFDAEEVLLMHLARNVARDKVGKKHELVNKTSCDFLCRPGRSSKCICHVSHPSFRADLALDLRHSLDGNVRRMTDRP